MNEVMKEYLYKKFKEQTLALYPLDEVEHLEYDILREKRWRNTDDNIEDFNKTKNLNEGQQIRYWAEELAVERILIDLINELSGTIIGRDDDFLEKIYLLFINNQKTVYANDLVKAVEVIENHLKVCKNRTVEDYGQIELANGLDSTKANRYWAGEMLMLELGERFVAEFKESDNDNE